MSLEMDSEVRLQRALGVLEGLSVGDAFGERFFAPPHVVTTMLEQRLLAPAPWTYTDDTEMALAIVEVLARHGSIHRDDLAETFARRYRANRQRGYGGTAHEILQKISVGLDWREVSAEPFDGQGSMGNGGAMRVPPLGSYFADDDTRLVEEARSSAIVTHFHPEGQAGAIAVAAATAWAWRSRGGPSDPKDFFSYVVDLTPPGETRNGIVSASRWPLQATPTSAARELGSGQRVLAQDTVPFTLWCAVRHLDDYEEALWAAVAGLGDRDTTCAIVGGIVTGRLGPEGIPRAWRSAREPLPKSLGRTRLLSR